MEITKNKFIDNVNVEGEESPKGNDGDEDQVQPQHVHLRWKSQIINP